MLYLIGLGLNVDGISTFGLESAKKCKKIYLENYTVDFPYSQGQLEEVIGKKINSADREKVESLEIVDEAKKMDVALLVYGSPLTATTHISLIQEANRLNIKSKVIFSASVLDAVAATGLQIYKFGKIASMPRWDLKKHYKPDSFAETIRENQSINAHSLILADIGLEFQDALKQLDEAATKNKIKLNKIIVCQALGTKNQKIFYEDFGNFWSYTGIRSPYCFIIPGKLHFLEREILESFEK